MPSFVGEPTCTLNPSGRAPLTAALDIVTDEACAASLEIEGGGRQWLQAFHKAPGGARTLPVLGLRAGTKYAINLALAGGAAFSTEIETAPLPDDFPVLKIHVCEPSGREPGIVMFALRNTGRGGGPGNGRIVAIDEQGDPVWIFNAGGNLGDFRRMASGNIMFVTAGAIVEVDMLGNEVARWTSAPIGGGDPATNGIPIAVQGFHHAAMELPGGNILAIGAEKRRLDAYPSSETDADAPKAPADVKGDIIVEFDRDGNIINEIKLLDILDPDRICYYSVVSGEAGGPGGDGDWSHSNGLDYDPVDDAFILSIRHQDAIAKIGRTTGEIFWIIGDHAGWGEAWHKYLLQPDGDVGWQYHQHDPSFTPDGNILCFDNGNCRAVPFTPRMPAADCYSRLVEYAVDEDKGTVRQAWAFTGANGEKIYASSQGGAIWLPQTGNVFGDFACCRTDADGVPNESNAGDAKRTAWLIEVTHDDAPMPVFDLEFQDRSEDAKDFSSFRAIHVPSLYL